MAATSPKFMIIDTTLTVVLEIDLLFPESVMRVTNRFQTAPNYEIIPVELIPGEDVSLEIRFDPNTLEFMTSLNQQQQAPLHAFELQAGASTNLFYRVQIQGALKVDYAGFLPPCN